MCIRPTGPWELPVPVSMPPMFMILNIVCTVLLVTMLAFLVVGRTKIPVVLRPVPIVQRSALPPSEIPITFPCVCLTVPVTVVGILWVPLQLRLMWLLLLLIMASVAKSTRWLFPIAPVMWPMVTSPLSTLLLPL